MPLLRLEIVNQTTVSVRSFQDEQGRILQMPFLRLMTSVVIGKDQSQEPEPQERKFRALIDTGCARTLIPSSVWKQFAHLITRLEFSTEEVQIPPQRRIAGGSYSYFLGRIWMGFLDPEGRRLPAVPVIAEFIEDEAFQFPSILIGLWGGILDGRRLWREPNLAQEEPAPKDEDPSAQTPDFGQRWWLADG